MAKKTKIEMLFEQEQTLMNCCESDKFNINEIASKIPSPKVIQEKTIIFDVKEKVDMSLKGWIVLLDNDDVPIKSYELNKPKITIGRNDDNSVILNDKTISSYHAVILVDSDGVSIIDNDSTNGVCLNNLPRASAKLKDGDIITLGKIKILVKLL